MPRSCKDVDGEVYIGSLMDLNFKRIQFTPDLIAGDILGRRFFGKRIHEPGKKFFQFNEVHLRKSGFWLRKSTGLHRKHKAAFAWKSHARKKVVEPYGGQPTCFARPFFDYRYENPSSRL